MTGRQFILPDGGWLALGRDEKDNVRLAGLKTSGDILLRMSDHPGPTALLRRAEEIYHHHSDALERDLERARGLLVRYAKKVEGRHLPQRIEVQRDTTAETVVADPIGDLDYMQWMI